MNLAIIALDLSEQEAIAELIDDYHESGLIENCLILDLGNPDSWTASWPNEVPSSLDNCLMKGLWTNISLVSVRSVLGAENPSKQRLATEEQIYARLTNAYSGGSVKVSCSTLSLFGNEISDNKFPGNYRAHYLHEQEIEIDPRLLKREVDNTNRDALLAFVGLTLSGAGRWANESKVSLINDSSIGFDRTVRFVKVQSRIGICGPLVGNAVRTAIRPGGGNLPVGAGPLVAMDSDHNLLRKVSDQFIAKYRFTNQKLPALIEDGVTVSPWRAFIDLLQDLPKYLGKAAKAEWKDRVDSLTLPLLKRLQGIAYGDDSKFHIEGVPFDASSVGMERFAAELKTRLEGMDGASSPSASPDAWESLVQTSFALLDASDFPEGLDAPYSGGRVVFMNPNVVGPGLEDDLFVLSISDCDTLELPHDRAREVGIFDALEAAKLYDEVKEAADKVRFRSAVKAEAAETAARRAAEAESVESSTRLRGTLSRTEKIVAKKEATAEMEASASKPKARSANEILEALKEWEFKRQGLSQDSFIAHLAMSLDKAVTDEFEAIKIDELKKDLEKLAGPVELKKFRIKKILKFFALLLLPLLLVAFLISSVLGVITTVFGLPILVFAGIAWGTSFAGAIVHAVIRRALEMRRNDINGRKFEGEITHKHRELINAINEFRRLQILRMQFLDWQRLVRELVHQPYGKVSDTKVSADLLPAHAMPPQLVVVGIQPSSAQELDFRNHVHNRLKVRGYLSGTLSAVRADWKDDYESIAALPRNAMPELDTSPPSISPGVRAKGREYFFPRRDFVQQTISGSLRTEMVGSRVFELSQNFFNSPVEQVLSVITAEEAKSAFEAQSPIEFLKTITQMERSRFNPNVFSPSAAGDLFMENVDERFSSQTRDGNNVIDFLLSGADEGIIIGATRMHVSLAIEPRQLNGYKEDVQRPGTGPSVADGPEV